MSYHTIKIPFTHYLFYFGAVSGGCILNGNGRTHVGIQIGFERIHGNGDHGISSISDNL